MERWDIPRKFIVTSFVLMSLPLFLHSEINIYFTHSVDTLIANPSPAHGYAQLDVKLIERITQAQYSIDFCFYNIKRQNIVDSLLSAFYRGIDVRVITEHDHIDNQAVLDIMSAGIPVIDDTYGSNSGGRYMHNKFAIFDFRDSSSVTDDWIWTGSYNITDEGTESNANNAIEIQHSELARAYTLEFEEMWGSSTNTPDSVNSKFSTHKTDNTEHSFLIDSIPVELYFSPSDNSTEKITNTISTADSSIYFCILAYTRQDVCDSMKSRWDIGSSVKGVFDRADWLGFYSKSRDITGDPSSNNPWSPPAPVYSDSVNSSWGPKMLHHKYMLIDADFNSEPAVITGSQNWSNNGELYNDENILIIHSQVLANQYLQEFVERYREAGGVYVGCQESEDRSQRSENRLSVYPNPFTSTTTITLHSVSENRCIGVSELQIFDISGRKVREISLLPFSFLLGAKATWDGRDNNGEVVPAGVYFVRLFTLNSTRIRLPSIKILKIN
jgi:phosphatidylserine/phosphatidylglycerophosphate/cardiolipin synthase-like enzyme